MMRTSNALRIPDDCTLGFVVSNRLSVNLTRSDLLHSHLERLRNIDFSTITEQVHAPQLNWFEWSSSFDYGEIRVFIGCMRFVFSFVAFKWKKYHTYFGTTIRLIIINYNLTHLLDIAGKNPSYIRLYLEECFLLNLPQLQELDKNNDKNEAVTQI